MTRKELVVGVAVPLTCAVVSGAAVLWFTPDWEVTARSKGWVPAAEWQADARRQRWIPENECPGFPVTLRITAPGDGASLRVSRKTISSRFVVEQSRPIKDASETYLVVQKKGDLNLHICHHLYQNTANFVYLPFQVDQPTEITLWAIIAADPANQRTGSREGEIYTDISQIRSLRGLLCISDPIRVSLVPDK